MALVNGLWQQPPDFTAPQETQGFGQFDSPFTGNNLLNSPMTTGFGGNSSTTIPTEWGMGDPSSWATAGQPDLRGYYQNVYPGMPSVNNHPQDIAQIYALLNQFGPQGNGIGRGKGRSSGFNLEDMTDSGNSGIPFNGNPQAGFNETGRGGRENFNVNNDPLGVNHNIFSNFLTNDRGPNSLAIAQAQLSGSQASAAAREWLRQFVNPNSATAKPGATNFDEWYRNFINTNFPRGNATPGANTRNGFGSPNTITQGNGTPPPTIPPITPPGSQQVTPQGTQSTNGIFPAPTGTTVNSTIQGTSNNYDTPETIAAKQALAQRNQQQQSGMDSYNNALDLVVRLSLGLPEGTQVTDAQRRQFRLPSRTELQMNQQHRQQNPKFAPDASMFVGGQVPNGAAYLPTGAAPNGFKYNWFDPDGAGQLPGNYQLVAQNPQIHNYQDYQNLFNIFSDPTYGNKQFDFGKFGGLFTGANNNYLTSPLGQNDFQRLLSQAQSPFYGTPLGGGNALGNYIASQGSGATNAALGQTSTSAYGLPTTAFDPGVDGSGLSPSQIAPINRNFTQYPLTGTQSGDADQTARGNTSLTSTTNTTTTVPTGAAGNGTQSPAGNTITFNRKPDNTNPSDVSSYYTSL